MGGGGGGGGESQDMLPWENLDCSYSQIPEGGFKINKQGIDTKCSTLKAQCFSNLKQQGTANNNAAYIGSTRDYCNLFVLAFELALFLHRADESEKGQNSCLRLQPSLCFRMLLVWLLDFIL